MTQAAALLAGFKADHVLADKGYDGRCVIDAVNESGAMPVIPSRKNAERFYADLGQPVLQVTCNKLGPIIRSDMVKLPMLEQQRIECLQNIS